MLAEQSKLKGRDHLGNINLDERIISKWITNRA
jgi:hypothetical protein